MCPHTKKRKKKKQNNCFQTWLMWIEIILTLIFEWLNLIIRMIYMDLVKNKICWKFSFAFIEIRNVKYINILATKYMKI